MAVGIGANDVANSMGISVGTKVLTVKQAILIAIVFEFAGAYFAGGEVTSTIRKGVIETSSFVHQPDILVYGMMSALLAAGTWLLLASYMGWPVSTTHSIIGAIIGFACTSVGTHIVDWVSVQRIVASWVITPAISGLIAYAIFISAQKLIFNTANPLVNAKRLIPVYMFLTVMVLFFITVKKGLKHINLHLSNSEAFFWSVGVSAVVMLIGYINIQKKYPNQKSEENSDENESKGGYSDLERVFASLIVVTACAMAFAHGSNDVANAIGPLSAIVATVENIGEITTQSRIAWWALPLGGLGIVVGLAVLGFRVIATVGTGITELTPSRGFAAELATACTVVLASGTGLPISTTQTLVGAVLGVGFARGIAALNLRVVRNIVASWIVTLPAGGLLSVAFFYIIKNIMLGI
ncbi:hypothetical protein CF67_04105 [Candidatus Photodesmus blepharus]|uniref:Phosphate transporter n=2 Tax=Candidatus Photodesmus blepharonis TaxID=1179155 RepID=A0A084CMT0_9GAMM|nr:hypothetical protein CF67_04105 [Candidatus Photodesmus blepharus]